MSDTSDFELPSDTEKLSHKYILDSLKQKYFAAEEAEPPLPPEPEMPALHLPPLELPADKRYFRVNEVARLIGVESHVIRYWQSEFSTVRPEKSGNGHWVYSRRDVEEFHRIRHLLHVEKYSIQGAKRKIRELKAQARNRAREQRLNPETLRWLARELRELIQLARNTPG